MRNIGFRAISINVPDMEGQWVTTDEVGFVNFFYALKEGDLDEKTLGEKTGLKDKNGKEIYEGDILRWIEWEQEGLEDWDRYIVKYDTFRFITEWFREGQKGLAEDTLERPEYFEVIGNIYENPDLLKI